MYKWAWLEYNRKDKSWTYGGMQKRKDKADENEEGQGRIKGMFADNQIDIKEGGKQNGDDSGKGNDESDAGIWMVETLRRRLRIGTIRRGNVSDIHMERRIH